MKAKSVSSAKKRIASLTGTGKLLRRNISAQHRTHGKSKRVLRDSNKTSVVSAADTKKLKKLILK